MPSFVPFRDLLRLLMDVQRSANGKRLSASVVAHAIGLSDQTILDLLNGTTADPQIETVHLLCRYFRISVDYFECETIEQAREYLAETGVLPTSQVIHEITDHSANLSGHGQQNIMRIMEWINRARTARRLKRGG